MRVRDCDPRLLQGLHRRGLVYFDVSIRPDDHVSIPPLEVRRAWEARFVVRAPGGGGRDTALIAIFVVAPCEFLLGQKSTS